MHDDRAYVIAMLALHLQRKRRSNIMNPIRPEVDDLEFLAQFPTF